MASPEYTKRTTMYGSVDPRFLRGSLENKVALVTGSSRGIGKQLATALALAGADVAIHGRDQATVDAAVVEISTAAPNSKVEGFVADVLVLSDQQRLADEVLVRFGSVDILICNAGTNLFQPFHQTKATEWWDQINLNLRAPTELTRILMPHFMKRNSGTIIYVSSKAAVNPFPWTLAYNASKGGLSHFATSLQNELDLVQKLESGFETNGISVFSIHPGEHKTDLHKTAFAPELKTEAPYVLEFMQRMGKHLPDYDPMLPAWTVVFLASGKAAVLNGQYVDCTVDVDERIAGHTAKIAAL